jgi:hypothetical protein
MKEASDHILEKQREELLQVKNAPMGTKLKVWTRLCGPGWLQSAITLGGGTLGASLYLGVLGGYGFMWLQPLMMILGIVMLGAIAYVTLSTGEKPLAAMNKHVNPVLGYGWVTATIMANLVWAMPQFSLSLGALEQNFGLGSWDSPLRSPLLGAITLAICATTIIFYDRGGRGVKIFEGVLKALVGVVVLSFFLVVLVLAFSEEGLPWGKIWAGFVPNPNLLFNVSADFESYLQGSSLPDFWRGWLLSEQRENMIAASATAVGINMTFLLPYSMLRKKWDKEFRELAVFDLSTGLFIPFLLVVGCVVIATASQFHAKYDAGLTGEEAPSALSQKLEGGYYRNLERFANQQGGAAVATARAELEPAAFRTWLSEHVSLEDRRLAAMLVRRDSFHLATTLDRLTGPGIAQKIFGGGVYGMVISTIIILMLINGFAFREAFHLKPDGIGYRVATLLPGFTGYFGSIFLWGDANARAWLVMPTSIFGMILLPIAYITFFCMMNSQSLMGENMPRGRSRVIWNTLMALAISAALIGCLWSVYSKAGFWGFVAIGVFALVALIVGAVRKSRMRGVLGAGKSQG